MASSPILSFFFFFFNDTATTEIYTLSLHDALPISLSGEARDLQRTDRLALELFPENDHLRRWIALAQARVAFQGLPARICWLGQGERARFGCALNDLVQRGELAAPIVIRRDHPDTGPGAAPLRGAQ